MKLRNKWIAALLASSLVLAQGSIVMAEIAPDGKTVASGTEFDDWKRTVWDQIKTDWTIVSLTPGADETQMNMAWYSKSGETVTLKYGQKSDLSDGVLVDVEQQPTEQTDADGISYDSNKATLTGLTEDTVYYYQVSGKEIETFKTGKTDSFTFAFVGDPQIGSSNEMKAKKPENLTDEFYEAQDASVANDSYNWSNTLNKALEKNESINFIVSAGDQIQTNAKKVENTTVSEIEYTGYLSPKALTSLPVATTVGNHDSDNANYQYHFNVPNLSDLGANEYVGGDYYFTYGDVLFMILNTQDTEISEHQEFIEKTVQANSDCKWKIVTLHQDIYGSAEHSNEPEIVNLRYALTPIFEECDVDIVLAGHDHAYSRSKFVSGGMETKEVTYTDDEFDEMLEKDIDVADSEAQIFVAPANIQDTTTDEAELKYLAYLKDVMDENRIVEDANEVVNPEGILYLTAGSASGSKYYDLTGRCQSYIINRWQEDVPTYSLIDVTDTTITINSYRADTNEKIDDSLTIIKENASEENKESEENTNSKENVNTGENNNTGEFTDSELQASTEKADNTESKTSNGYIVVIGICIVAVLAGGVYVFAGKKKKL